MMTAYRSPGVFPIDEAWAREILMARKEHGDGVFMVNGEMVDAPALVRAERRARAKRTGSR